jgi:hypothetical protein
LNAKGKPLQRVHVDVARKADIWGACCEHLNRNLGIDLKQQLGDTLSVKQPISDGYFLALLRDKYDVVMHKHKKFSQCLTCFLFKQLLASTVDKTDRAEIRLARQKHFDTVFEERVIYHITRNYAKEYPWDVLSMIVDAQSAWRTQGPTLPREVSGFPSDFEPFGQQLYGVLVHANPTDMDYPGGFFGYMVDDSVKGGVM